MKYKKFVAVAAVLVLAVTCLMIWKSTQPEEVTDTAAAIRTYEECVKVSRPTMEQGLWFTCAYQDRTYAAQLDACIEDCYDSALVAVENFCRQEYGVKILGQQTYGNYTAKFDEYQGPASTSHLDYRYRGKPVFKNEFFRASFWCVQDKVAEPQEDQLTVYFKQSGSGWEPYLTVEKQNCEDIDHKGIPVALSGVCFDSQRGGFRIPAS